MGRKLFEADDAVEQLLSRYAKEHGVKIGSKINQSVYNAFLPQEAQPLVVEANYILQEHMAGRLQEDTIKQSLSRGISWLKNYPIDDSQIISSILTHYNNAPFKMPEMDQRNKYVKKLYEDAESKLKEIDKSYVNYYTTAVSLGEDICAHWQDVWQERVMYEVLSYMIYACKVERPYDWYDCIAYLKQIEIAAMYRYNLTAISRSR